MNGEALAPSEDVSEPYPNAHTALLGRPEELRAWAVPPALLRAGENRIEVRMESGQPTRLVFLDLAVS